MGMICADHPSCVRGDIRHGSIGAVRCVLQSLSEPHRERNESKMRAKIPKFETAERIKEPRLSALGY